MKRSILIVAFVIAVLGVLAIRVVVEGRRALADGDAALAAGRPLDAIRAYETAARWYLPAAPHVEAAYDKLRGLASTGGADAAVPLAAWRAIRGAARATRTMWQPHAEDLARADEAIATLSAAAPGAATREVAWHRERLVRDVRPGTGKSVVAGLGVLLWLAGALTLVRRGFTPKGALVPRWGIAAGAVSLVGVVCWVLGLYNA